MVAATNSGTTPRVGVVVVNYFGADHTRRCLESLERLTWPAQRLTVALVDNGSEDGFVRDIRSRFPAVQVVESGSNIGFGGACNLGFEQLRHCEFIALVNNDAIPDPGWLEPLVDVLRNRRDAGAVTPKVLLDGKFVRLEIRSDTVRPGGGDPRELGVQLCGARVDDVDVTDSIELVSGFWGWERDAITVGGPFTWTAAEAVAHLPAGASARPRVEVRLASGHGPTKAEIRLAGSVVHLHVETRPTWGDVGIASGVVDLVNNAGVVLRADGSAVDRGYLDADDGQFDESAEVFGWSGAAVLLSRRYLEDVGGFDPSFFLYYEDTDLSWRGRLRGWSHWYEPRSVVRHEHSATVGRSSGLATHLLRRNELLCVAKNAPTSMVAMVARRELRVVRQAVGRDVVGRIWHRTPPTWIDLGPRLRVLLAVLRRLPSVLVARRGLMARARYSPRRIAASWVNGEGHSTTDLRVTAQGSPRRR